MATFSVSRCLAHCKDSQALQWQGKQSLDAILNYPMYNALVDAFTIPGSQNMSAVTTMIEQIKQKSSVCQISLRQPIAAMIDRIE